MSQRPTEHILNDPVSAHVRRDVATIRPDWTLAEALDHMRAHPPGGRVVYFYATDADDKLVGVVPTRRLLLSRPEAKIADIMIRQVVAVPEDATVLEACEFFTLHRLLAFPVVGEGRKLVGVIDVELYTKELAGEAGGVGEVEDVGRIGDDVFEIIGVHKATAEQANPMTAFRGRFPWLVCNVAGGLIAAVLAGFFDDVLTWRNAVLALFIPVVLALCESVSIQSVTLAVGRLRSAGTGNLRAGLREAVTGVLLGASVAGLVALVAAVWLRDWTVVFILFDTIGVGVTAAAVIGYAVPTLLHRFRLNPQVAAGPISLATADVFTLLVYFNLARVFAPGL
jgi:magnesium transporter